MIVHQADGAWDNPSPCTEWDARGVVEHVIGFHDVLLLRPTGTKPQRPKDDPVARWDVTGAAIRTAIDRAATQPTSADDPSQPDLARLLPMLTTELLLHSWDLARAVGVDPRLDSGLCEASYEMALLQRPAAAVLWIVRPCGTGRQRRRFGHPTRRIPRT